MIHRRLVDFHGEVLLLVHWSVLAYTATVKVGGPARPRARPGGRGG